MNWGKGHRRKEEVESVYFLPSNGYVRKPYHKPVWWLRVWALEPGCWGLNMNLAIYSGKLLCAF